MVSLVQNLAINTCGKGGGHGKKFYEFINMLNEWLDNQLCIYENFYSNEIDD